MAVGFTVARRQRPEGARAYPLTDQRTRLTAVTLLVALNVLDVLTTRRVLFTHGGFESTPISGWLISHGLLGASKAALVVGIGLMTVKMPARRASSLALWLVVGFYLAVVRHNVMQIASVS